MLNRLGFENKILDLLNISPICAILGPRQCGKTTLARNFTQKHQEKACFFDLEDPIDLAKLDNPKLALEPLDGLIVIDEIQRRPNLFPFLRVLVDKIDRQDKKILILGSASQDLIRQSSESLAGRINYIELTPFSLSEIDDFRSLWLRGGYPRSYLAKSDLASAQWRKGYMRTYLERDLREFGFDIPPQTMRRFWQMLAHYHGQIFNASEIAGSIGISNKTADRYLDILHGTFMVRRLSPWFENISKRQVKSPKIYFRDSGIIHLLLNINTWDNLVNHPKIGASWEGFALEETIRHSGVDSEDCYYWATQGGAELDLLISLGDKKYGFEIKYTDSPKISKSMRIAIEDLKLSQLYIIIPGKEIFMMDDKIKVIGLESLSNIKNLLS